MKMNSDVRTNNRPIRAVTCFILRKHKKNYSCLKSQGLKLYIWYIVSPKLVQIMILWQNMDPKRDHMFYIDFFFEKKK